MAECRGDLPERFWRDGELLRAEVEAHGTLASVARAHGARSNTLANWWTNRHGFEKLPDGRPPKTLPGVTPAGSEPPGDEWLLDVLKRAGGRATIENLADVADVSPRRVREAVDGVRLDRVAPGGSRAIAAEVSPSRSNPSA